MGGIRADVEPWSFYRARNYALFVNGLWANNQYISSENKTVRIAHPITPGSTRNATIAVVEVGDHEQFDESWFVPGGWIKEEESVDAARIRIHWTAGYSVDSSNGEDSLSSVTLTGLTRFGNCEPDQKFQGTRARAWYTIENISGTYFVRLFSNGWLTCSGSRVGDGLVTLAENNGSGLSGSAILTYTADVVPNQAFIAMRWPGSYNLHYSTSPLTYPRTPEMVIYDKGVSNYVALTAVLGAGSYNYAVQAVGDDATAQLPVIAPTDTPKVVKQPPLPVKHGTPTGNAAAITMHWTAGEPGCSYTVYSSLVDEPVNVGQWPLPWAITRPVGANSATLQPVLNYTPLDRTADWTAFVSGIDNVVSNMDSAYLLAPTLFTSSITTNMVNAQALLQTLSAAVSIPTVYHADRITNAFSTLSDQATSFSDITVQADYQDALRPAMSAFLNAMSVMLDGKATRYTFADGSLPWAGTGTTDGTNGSNNGLGQMFGLSVKDLVSPLVTNRIVRSIVRATRVIDGLQEVCDEVLEIEIDSLGDIVLPRPNPSFVSDMSCSGLQATFTMQSRTDDQSVAAARLAIWYAIAPASPDFSTGAAASVAASQPITGLVTGKATITFPSQGYYVVGSKALSSSGVQSLNSAVYTIWVGTAQPAAPLNPGAEVIREMPIELMEDD